jgi:hypothetical protein
MVSNVVSYGVTFRDLDPDKAYFPNVSRDTSGAFVASQPESVKPPSEPSSSTYGSDDSVPDSCKS